MSRQHETIAALDRAIARLQEKHDAPRIGLFERARLHGKIEGMKLARAYMEDGVTE